MANLFLTPFSNEDPPSDSSTSFLHFSQPPQMTLSSPFPYISRLPCISANCSGWVGKSRVTVPSTLQATSGPGAAQKTVKLAIGTIWGSDPYWYQKNHDDLCFIYPARFGYLGNSWKKGSIQKILSESLLWPEWVQKEMFLKIRWASLASGEDSALWHLVQHCGKKRLQGSHVLHCPREVTVSEDAD